jgi:hypothetical protein
MQFKVPQFIDIEDKIFGPFTFRQFAYLAGGGGLAYLSLKIFPFVIGVIIALPIIGFALALAFVKINEKPFIHMVEAFLTYHSRSRLYLWKKQIQQKKNVETPEEEIKARNVLTESKLKTLSWSLNVLDPNK